MQLDPCPFCGGAGDYLETGVWWVRCDECGADAASGPTREDAAVLWNRRAPSPSPAPGVVTDEMVEAAKRIRDLAMKQTVMARIPECGDFAAIAQDADWLLNKLTAAIGAGGQAVARDWVSCPICNEPDMRKETDGEGHSLIYCVNHACPSNGSVAYPHPAPSGQAVAWRISCPDDEIYGRGPDTLRFYPLSSDEIASGYTQQPLFSNPPAQPGWRSMDDCPDDARPILVFTPINKQPIAIRPADGSWWRNPISGSATPTHWMPLPAAPQPTSEGE